MLSSHFPTIILFFFCFETALFPSCSTGNVLSLGQGREKIKLEKQPCLLLAQGQEAGLTLPPLHLECPSPPLSSQPPRGCGTPRSGLSCPAAWPLFP